MTNSSGVPRILQVIARLDDSPAYKGSSHDDETARMMGFRAALIPGAFVYGHISRVAIFAWGEAWAMRGAIKVRFRRPVYNGDVLTFVPTPLGSENGPRYAILASNQLGEAVADGDISLQSANRSSLNIDELPILPRVPVPPRIGPGGMTAGMTITTANNVLSADDLRISLEAFDERHPIYERLGIVHSGCLLRRTMADCLQSFAFPQPVIFTAVEAQHFQLVKPGQRLATSGRVVAAYERKGRHYFDSEEFLIADGSTVAARFLRTNLYA